MSEKEIRDLDVSEEEGEDVKGGRVAEPGPMPPSKNPGVKDPISPVAVAPGVAAPKSGLSSPKAGKTAPRDPATGKMPGRMPPS